MGKHYSHLSLFERQLIFQWYHYEKRSQREIARRLSRSHGTISRELRRNIQTHYVPTWYPHLANKDYQVRIRDRGQRIRLKTVETRKYVREKLISGWAPEIISGRLKYEKKLSFVCHESIYQFIYKEEPELIQHLPRKHKKRRVKYPCRKKVAKTSGKISISERSEAINNRSCAGHWESDSIISKGSRCALNVLVERYSRLTHITKLSSKKSLATKNAIIKKLINYSENFVLSITYDNGSENAEHLKINEKLNCDSYFCLPYHSWEKGAVEQVNSLIRRYLPKKKDFKDVTSSFLKNIEHQLNSRPRKCLGYKTPFEVYNELHGALTG